MIGTILVIQRDIVGSCETFKFGSITFSDILGDTFESFDDSFFEDILFYYKNRKNSHIKIK